MLKYIFKKLDAINFYNRIVSNTLFIIFSFMTVATYSQVASNVFPLSPLATKTLVDSLTNQIIKYYVNKEAAIKMNSYIKKRYKEGHYNNIKDPHALAGALTSDILFINHDEHFHMEYNPQMTDELLGNIEDVPKMVAEKLRLEKEKNFGFKKVEIISGNIGYLELSGFSRLNKFSKTTADAALKLLSNSRAIIIDLRYGVGGSPDMVNHIISHFFKSPTHVIDIYIRSENATLPYWTVPDSSYGVLTEIPLYILTSYKTFSAAEGLSYELQALKRATIVGETTRGGAHTVTYRPLSSGFICDIPFGRAISPITKRNWEKIGVIPDIKVPADRALEIAETKIFEEAFDKAKDSLEIKRLKWQLELVQSVNHPIQLDTSTFKGFTGLFGAYAISYNTGVLYYQKTGKAKFPLIPMTSSMMRVKGNDTFTVEFFKNFIGKINRIATRYDDGRVEYAERTD
ncbi:S41 family peptidase [Aurantibacillus circumpalustris]|uniref:S41 family peptidase n=1 Tax=Aurantibacillus circumpalustris TaxID=3036359 RepID=UPI00295A62F3|nr:S41 family peptidase [Aurantibacillus circumpalustris]